jgi:hypothetical protein
MGIVGEDQGDLGLVGDGGKACRQAGGERPLDQDLKRVLGGPAVGLDQDIGGDRRAAGGTGQRQIPSPGGRSGAS